MPQPRAPRARGFRWQARFQSFRDERLSLEFPCALGRVELDELSDRARIDYLFARAVVGYELEYPFVVLGAFSDLWQARRQRPAHEHILAALKAQDARDATNWTDKHITDFRGGFELANLDTNQPVVRSEDHDDVIAIRDLPSPLQGAADARSAVPG